MTFASGALAVVFVLLFLFLLWVVAAVARTAILVPTDAESGAVYTYMRDIIQVEDHPPTWYGILHGHEIMLAIIGVGKDEAGWATWTILARHNPDAVILCGVAGALSDDLYPWDVVVGATVSDDARTFYADKRLLLRAQAANAGALYASVSAGAIYTADAFLSDPRKRQMLRLRTGADVVEMEGSAVAQACEEFGIPWLVIRGVSDRAGDRARSELGRFRRLAADRAGLVTIATVKGKQ